MYNTVAVIFNDNSYGQPKQYHYLTKEQVKIGQTAVVHNGTELRLVTIQEIIPGASKKSMIPKEVITKLAEKFCATPLPASVCADACASTKDYKHHRSGTNLMTVDEAAVVLAKVLDGVELHVPGMKLKFPDHPGDVQRLQSYSKIWD